MRNNYEISLKSIKKYAMETGKQKAYNTTIN